MMLNGDGLVINAFSARLMYVTSRLDLYMLIIKYYFNMFDNRFYQSIGGVLLRMSLKTIRIAPQMYY